MKVVVHMPAYDFARLSISDQTRVDAFSLCGQVRDVSHPDLLATCCAILLLPSLEQIRMAAKPVMTVSGLVIRPSLRHQHPSVAQHIKHIIVPQYNAHLSQGLAQHMVQLSRAQ
jgi:hypothetical protein